MSKLSFLVDLLLNRRLQVKIRTNLLFIKGKIKQPTYIVSIFLSLVFFATTFHQLQSFTSLIHDNETEKIISQQNLFLLLLIPIILLYLNFLLILRIVIQRLKKQAGSFLRFKIISFFFLSLLIPSLLFFFFFSKFLNNTLNLVRNNDTLTTLTTRLSNYQEQINRENIKLKENFYDKLEQGNFTIYDNDKIDYLAVYDDKGSLLLFNHKLKISQIPKILLNPVIKDSSVDSLQRQQEFSSYSSENGYNYYLYRSELNILNTTEEQTTITNYYTAFSFVEPNLKTSINDTIKLMRQFQQLSVSFKPIADFMLYAFIYFYIQVYSIAIIIFYYYSKTYTKPIEELIVTTKKISQGHWDKINLTPFIRKMNKNEIKQLLISFSDMIQDFIDNRKRIDRLSKVEAWKEVATRLAHELKNPLTPIKLATNEIENHLSQTDIATYAKLHNKFQFIHTEVERIESLIQDFSLLSKNLNIRRKKTHITDLILHIQEYPSLYPKIKFIKEIIWNGEVFLDPEKIQQVLVNLLQNAMDSVLEKKRNLEKIHHQPRNSLTSTNDYEPTITIVVRLHKSTTSSDAPRLIIEIKDNGIGVAEENIEELFKPYVTYKTWGTGLGLPICREIVNGHYGEINCISQENNSTDATKNSDYKETIFRISLPLSS